MDNFTDKIAVVTGGASGIGQGIARALAAAGAHIVVADIDGDAANKSAEDLRGRGVRSIALRTDVRDDASVAALFDATQNEFGGIDLLFNNAGVYLGGEMKDCTEDDWRFVLDVNLDGVFRVGQRAAAFLREQNLREAGRGGHIVNTASIGGFLSHGSGLAYAVSKYGVVAYSEAMREDLEADGIGVSTLCPGPIDTNLPASDRLRTGSEKTGGMSEALSPFIRGGMKPDDVGPIVLSGIRRNLPYIFTHDDMRDVFQARFDSVMDCIDRIGEPA
ncbi:MAG: SDR family NAD(P)-dependent oxidoreductase [bacterium]|nr:short-chain dehydrogenase [Deltaproteobacteria bacterium]MCP4904000.1 SDR family NAD(P)-dependent oxidoreductase [bacterium]